MTKNQSGITLVSLVVTILIMLILASVAINLSVGDNGLIGQTQNSVNAYLNSSDQEQDSVNDFSDSLNEAINGGSNNIKETPSLEIVNWNSVGGLVEISTQEGYDTEYKIGNEEWKKYENKSVEVKNGLTIFARYVDKDGNSSNTVSKVVKDTNPPKLTAQMINSTSTTATIKASATDSEMGMPNPIVYMYYIKNKDENNYNYVGQNNTGSYTFENLSATTKYFVLVTAKDIAGNLGSVELDTETGEDISAPDLIIGKNIFFDLNPSGPTKDNVSVTIRTSGISSDYHIEYSIKSEANYQEYTSSITMTENGKVYARVTNGTKISNSVYIDVTNIDKGAPSIGIQVTERTNNSISIKAVATDSGLGMPSPIVYKYYIRINGQGEYVYKTENNTGVYTFTELQEGISYDIKVTTSDKVGNVGSKEITDTTNQELPPDLIIGENILFGYTPEGPTKENVMVTITTKNISNKFYIEYSIDNESNYIKYSNPITMTTNGRVYARVSDGKNHSNSVYIDITNIDKLAPKGTLNLNGATTKSITATVSEVSDTGLGMPDDIQYKYYIRKIDGSYGEASYTGSNTNYTFTELDHNTNYEIKVTFSDKAGNEAILTKTQVTTKVPDLTNSNTTFELSETRITNKPITVTITTTVTGYTLQYSIDGNNYQNYTEPITIDKNLTIYARLWDNRNSTGNYGIYTTKEITNVDTSLSDLEVLIKRDEFVTENTTVTDGLDNKITIPEGFKPKDDATTIDKGVVVEDKNGNQFVWIPVGHLKTSSGTVIIGYHRYAKGNWYSFGQDYETQSMKIQTENKSMPFFVERLNESEKNSAVENGGYYIGRYEAGTTHERTSATGTQDKLEIKQNSYIYNWVNYTEAKNLAEGMYSSENYTSNLTSSYAWDTALHFLHQTGNTSYLTNSTLGNYYNTKYGGKTQLNSSVLLKAGETRSVNNIYDLGGNVYEWTTETYSKAANNKVARGGCFAFESSDEPAIGRLSTTNSADSAIGFRVALFIGKVEKNKSSLELARDNQTQFTQNTKLEDDEGKTLTVPGGFKVSQDSDTIINNGVVIEEVETGNEFVWVPVTDPNKLFTEETVKLNKVQTMTDAYSKLTVRKGDGFIYGKPGETTTIKEPDILDYYDVEENYKTILGFNSVKEMSESMVLEYKEMKQSLEKYNGFYVGRYELTGTVNNPKEETGTVLLDNNWHNLYKACHEITKNNSNVKSTMIYGVQWDSIVEWLKQTKFKGNEEKVDSDSSSWGNYNGTKIETGSNSNYQANKIFDLAGNCTEWTQEAYGIYDRILRGGNYSVTGSNSPVSDRYSIYYQGEVQGGYTSRPTLYIK